MPLSKKPNTTRQPPSHFLWSSVKSHFCRAVNSLLMVNSVKMNRNFRMEDCIYITYNNVSKLKLSEGYYQASTCTFRGSIKSYFGEHFTTLSVSHYRLICKTGTLKSTVLIGSALQVNFDHSFQNFPSPSILTLHLIIKIIFERPLMIEM